MIDQPASTIRTFSVRLLNWRASKWQWVSTEYKKQANIRDIFPRRPEDDMAEDMTESVGWLSMAVLLVHVTHPTEVSHEML